MGLAKMRDYNSLKKRAVKAIGPPPPCQVCASWPSLVVLGEDDPEPLPCPACGRVLDSIREVVVTSREQLAQRVALAAQEPDILVLGAVEYQPTVSPPENLHRKWQEKQQEQQG